MRVACGGLLHETATFMNRPTTLADFSEGVGLFRGVEMLERLRGTNMCPGGFIEAAGREGFELVPLVWAFAYPSGTVERQAYDALAGELVERFHRAEAESGRIDALLVDLHGAMVVEGIDDADGQLLETMRAVLGPKRPIVATFDMHSNHTRRRITSADAVVGYDTYPHVDMAQRGEEAGRLIARLVRREIAPRMALVQLPLFWPPARQATAHPPMDEVMRRVHALEQRPGMLSVTVATGFPWADVPDVGASVIVVADGDQRLADEAAQELADFVWQNRQQFCREQLRPREAIEQARRDPKPVFLADHADNTGGGAPGDSTEIVRAFLDLRLPDALVLYLVDAEIARAAHAAGVGARLSGPLGGKFDPIQGPPIEGEFEIVALSTGEFAYDGPMYAGMRGNMGLSAWLRSGGTNVVVVTARQQPLDAAFARSLGIDCRRMQWIAVKSAVHFRSGFEQMAGTIYNIDAQAILTHDWSQLQYRKKSRLVFPRELSLADAPQ